MHESTIRESGVHSTANDTKVLGRSGVRGAAWLALLMLATLPTVALAESS